MRALGVRVEQAPDRMILAAEPGHAMHVAGEGRRLAPERWMWTLEVRHPGIDRAWVIEPEDAITRVRKLVAGQDVLTGDAAFDAAVHIVGETRPLLACLGHATRARLTRLLPQGRLADGALRWAAPATGPRPPGLVDRLHDMLTVARTLGADVRPLTRLRRHMVRDPDPGHRRRAMEQAVLAGHALTPGERRALLRDADPDLRAAVARMLHDVETLGRLAADPRLPDPLRVGAVEALGECEPPAAIDALERAARSAGSTALEPALGRALGSTTDRHPEAIERLGEAATLALLTHGPERRRSAAIERLGEAGTERAVPPLAAIAGAFFARRALKDEARAAIDRITRRQGGLSRGGLSVADAEAGALTVSPPDR